MVSRPTSGTTIHAARLTKTSQTIARRSPLYHPDEAVNMRRLVSPARHAGLAVGRWEQIASGEPPSAAVRRRDRGLNRML
jgi:hypothetical protein